MEFYYAIHIYNYNKISFSEWFGHFWSIFLISKAEWGYLKKMVLKLRNYILVKIEFSIIFGGTKLFFIIWGHHLGLWPSSWWTRPSGHPLSTPRAKITNRFSLNNWFWHLQTLSEHLGPNFVTADSGFGAKIQIMYLTGQP